MSRISEQEQATAGSGRHQGEPVTIRPLEMSDAAEIAAMNLRNRADLERVSPPQTADTYTEAGQAARIRNIVRECAQGLRAHWTIRVGGVVAGDISLQPSTAERCKRPASATWSMPRSVAAAWPPPPSSWSPSSLRTAQVAPPRSGSHAEQRRSQRVLENAGFTRIGITPSPLCRRLLGGPLPLRAPRP